MPRWLSLGGIVSSLVANLLFFALPVVVALLIGLVTWLLGVGREATLVVLLIVETLVMLYAIPARARSDVFRFRRWRRVRRLRQTIPNAALPLDIRLTPEKLDDAYRVADAHVKARLPDAEFKAFYLNVSSSRLSDTERTPRLSIGFYYDARQAEADITVYFRGIVSSEQFIIKGEPAISVNQNGAELNTIETMPWKLGEKWLEPLQRAFAHYRTRADSDENGLPLFEMNAIFFANKDWHIRMTGDSFNVEKKWGYIVDYDGRFDAEQDSPPPTPQPPSALRQSK